MMHIIIIKCNTTMGASLLYSDYGNHVVYCNNVCVIILMYPDSAPFNVSTTQKCKKGRSLATQDWYLSCYSTRERMVNENEITIC